MQKVKMSASEAICETLVAEGIDHVTGIVGSAFMDLLDLFPAAGIRFIPVRHEQSAAHMEDAYSRISGKAGVCIGQNGPGITNMVTSVAAANMGHTPMVVICPSAGTPTVGWDGFQECDTVGVFKPITKGTVRIPHPSRAADCTRTAFRMAYALRGPVLLDVPRDYFYGEVEDYILEPHQYRVDDRGCGSPESLQKAAELFAKAERPVRNDRPQGERPVRTDRPQGERPVRTDRPQGERPSKDGFRGNDRNGGKRSFDREMDKFNKESAPAADDMRGKESRERNERRNNNNNNRRQDHDKLGKKQENFINLEKNGGKKKHAPQPQKPKEDPNEIKTITLPEKMTIKELADAMKLQPSVIIKNLFMKGKMVTMNHEVSFEEAEEIALEFNFICEQEEKVDVIAELFRCKIIGPNGKFIREGKRIRRDKYGIGSYVLADKEEAGSVKDVEINEVDIDNFIRAKGAIFSAIYVMLTSLDFDVSMIENVYVAGGIGSGINMENAINIGMFPDIGVEKYHYIGNSSLAGAYAMVLSEPAEEKVYELGKNMTYMELSTTPGYMDEFVAACFIPHTNSSLFPNVKQADI